MTTTPEEVFNTFPDADEATLGRRAVILKAQLFQVLGELARRGVAGVNDPWAIDEAIGTVLSGHLLGAYLSGKFDNEHEVLQGIIDSTQARQVKADDHVLSTDCPCGPEVEAVTV